MNETSLSENNGSNSHFDVNTSMKKLLNENTTLQELNNEMLQMTDENNKEKLIQKNKF
jgi:hypothetical protein